MNKTNGNKAKKKDQNQPEQRSPHANSPQQTDQWQRVPGEPGERSDKESIGRPVQLDSEPREQKDQSRPEHGEHPSPAHADKSRI